MLSEWGTWEEPIVDPAITAVLSKNMPDVLAVEEAIGGVKTILALTPHLEAIYKSYRGAPPGQEGLTIFSIMKTNSADILAIEQAVGIKTILSQWPHLLAIYDTYTGAKTSAAAAGGK